MGPGSLTLALTIAGCAIFPADNVWNTPVDRLPIHRLSSTWVETVGRNSPMHPDFGSGLFDGGPIGIPFVAVPGTQPRVPLRFEYSAESDPGPYPIPRDAAIEGGPSSSGDRHILVLDRDECVLYEVFAAYPEGDGWRAGSGAVWNLRSNKLRPLGWTSADAAGLPILPGLVRYDEVASGEIRHAIRFTVPQTRRQYVWPGTHFASSRTEERFPPMGARFRLRADYDISGFSPDTQVILRALKKYGMILADNGSSWFISGAPDERWNNQRLRELRRVIGSDFEAVDASSMMIAPDSGAARQTPAVVVNSATWTSGPVAPGEIVTIWTEAGANPSVAFDGVNTRVLYAGANQINVVVPLAIAGRRETELVAPGFRASVPVAPASPGIFAVLNQDYSLNTPANPAAPGSVIMIFGTGDGGNAATARVAGAEAEVQYSGPAPGFEGVMQVNVRVPEQVQAGSRPLLLRVGDYVSQADFLLHIR
jgi:uncharacterized protein (TIGR03437 family)